MDVFNATGKITTANTRRRLARSRVRTTMLTFACLIIPVIVGSSLSRMKLVSAFGRQNAYITLGDFDPSLLGNTPQVPGLLVLDEMIRFHAAEDGLHMMLDSGQFRNTRISFDRQNLKTNQDGRHSLIFEAGPKKLVPHDIVYCALFIPLSGITYGETFGSAVYLSYVALEAISLTKCGNFSEITAVIFDVPKSRGIERKVAEQSFDYCAHAVNEGEEHLWPTHTHTKFSVPRSVAAITQNFSDNSSFDVNFHSMLQHCPKDTYEGDWLLRRRDFVVEFLQSWGLKSVILANERHHFTFARRGFVLKPQLIKSWQLESCDPPAHLSRMIAKTKQHFLGHTPTARSTERNTITLVSRPCRFEKNNNCCSCKRVWLNEKDTFKHLKEEFPDKDVILIDMGKLSLNETVHLMDKTEILFGLHGSAMWNVFFMYHTSALVEIWPIGYFEAKYYNQPRFVGVTYVYEEALQGNWPGHDPWTTIALSQSSRLVNLSRALVDAKRKKLV